MANRVLRDTTDSEKVNQLSPLAERFLYRLFMKADDFGCFHADPRLLKAHLFPLQLDHIREADISRWTAECEKAGLIALYVSSGKQYLEIIAFGQRLRQMKRRFPKPDSDPLTTRCHDAGNPLPICGPETRNEGKLETGNETEGVWADRFQKAFDERTIETLMMTYRGIDVKQELERFKTKVALDESYKSYDTSGLRSAFQYQLRTAKPKQDGVTKALKQSAGLKELIRAKYGTEGSKSGTVIG